MDFSTLTVSPPYNGADVLRAIDDATAASGIAVVGTTLGDGEGSDLAGGGKGAALILAMLVLVAMTLCCCCFCVAVALSR